MHLLHLAPIFLGFLVPICIVLVRQSVKIQRQRLIRDIDEVFKIEIEGEGKVTIPSFEFVKYKYHMDAPIDPTNLQRNPYDDGQAPIATDFSLADWLCGILQLALLVFLVSECLIDWTVWSMGGGQANSYLDWTHLPHGQILIISMSAAFAGSYIAGISELYRSLNSFDLSPTSFIDMSKKMLISIISSVFIAALLQSIYGAAFGPSHWGEDVVISAVALTAFAGGYFPGVLQRNLLSRSHLSYWKKEDQSVYKAAFLTPIEIIDGIDSQVREELDDFYIFSVQNLATTNPIMLFVETPFGVYELMDWVAQAQLCASVGPKKLVDLWALGIRTIFDLERAIAKPYAAYNPKIVEAVGAIILGPGFDEAAIIASVQMRIDDPYIHRLRQIYICICDRLGHENRRFPPALVCGTPDIKSCPFERLKPKKAA